MRESLLKKIVLGTFAVLVISSTVFFSTVYKAQALTASLLKGVGSGAIGCGVNAGIGELESLLKGAVEDKVPVTDSAQVTEANKQSCLDVIGENVAQQLLKDLTQETLNWINSGFKGSPLFVQDTGAFLKGVGQEEIGGYITHIGFDPTKFPFGKETAQAIARSWLQGGQNYLDNNAAYSLNNYIGGHPEQDFADNFNVGGWDAFIAQSFFPGNNPIGFQLEASKQVTAINDSLSLTQTAVGQQLTELNQNKGFLNIKKCVDPDDYEDPADYTGTDWNMQTATEQSHNDPNDQDTKDAIEWLRKHTCNRWETQTPGNVVADQLTTALNIPQNELLNAKDLNDSLTAVFNALLSQLFNMGVQSLADSSGDPSLTPVRNAQFGGFGSNNSLNGPAANGTGNWSQSQITQVTIHNIDTALDHTPDPHNPSDAGGFLQIQYAYIDALRKENTAIFSLTPALNQLDFCIPGPNPNWQAAASKKMTALISQWASFDASTTSSAIKGPYFSSNVSALLGVNQDASAQSVTTYQQAQSVAQDALSQYSAFINQHYSASALEANGLTGVAGVALSYLQQVPAYQSVVTGNESEITRAQGIIGQLTQIQTALQTIPDLPDHSNDARRQTQLQTLQALLPQVVNEAAVAGVLSDMVTIQSEETSITIVPDGLLDRCEKATQSGGTYFDTAWSGFIGRIAPYPVADTLDPNKYASSGSFIPLNTFIYNSNANGNFSAFEKTMGIY